MTWNPIDSPFNHVRFESQKSPGHAVVEGNNGSPRKWDERSGYGLTGSTVVFTGLGLADFDVIISLYDRRDWAEWEVWQKVLEPPKPGVRARAIDVWHPLLAAPSLKIKACVVKNVSIPKQTDDGVWQVVIQCQAYRKVKLTLAKPEAAKATPTDPIDQRIEANSAIIASQLDELAR